MKIYDPSTLRPVRLIRVLTFVCDHCEREKTSKNIVLVGADKPEGKAPLLCNGCYGTILSRL